MVRQIAFELGFFLDTTVREAAGSVGGLGLDSIFSSSHLTKRPIQRHSKGIFGWDNILLLARSLTDDVLMLFMPFFVFKES